MLNVTEFFYTLQPLKPPLNCQATLVEEHNGCWCQKNLEAYHKCHCYWGGKRTIEMLSAQWREIGWNQCYAWIISKTPQMPHAGDGRNACIQQGAFPICYNMVKFYLQFVRLWACCVYLQFPCLCWVEGMAKLLNDHTVHCQFCFTHLYVLWCNGIHVYD
jgi:hypothetical protein